MVRRSSTERRPACFGIGYEKRSPLELCTLLKLQGVTHVIDVRQSAWSYRREYRKEALRTCLQEAGIKYTHMPEAGNPFRPRAGERKSFDSCRRDYAAFIGERPEVLASIHAAASQERVALLCYERDGDQCHRSVIVSQIHRKVGHVDFIDLQPGPDGSAGRKPPSARRARSA